MELGIYVSSEVDPNANRVVSRQWPDVAELGDISKIASKAHQRAWQRAPHLQLVVEWAGSRCQGVSGVNAEATGLDDQRIPMVEECGGQPSERRWSL